MLVDKEQMRKQRGLEIAKTCEIKKHGNEWLVPSQSGAGAYTVKLQDLNPECDCPDFSFRGQKCKHVFAVEYSLKQEINDGKMKVTQTVKMTYAQDWANYDKASINQGRLFLELLEDLIKDVEEPEYKFGRPKISYKDLIFSSILKVYTMFSLRRFQSQLNIAKEKGFIQNVPCFASLGHFMQKKELTPILKQLIIKSSLPLASIEEEFAVDASGFSTCRFDRWFNYRNRKDPKHKSWIKISLMNGINTNIVTAVELGKDFDADCPKFKPLLKKTAENFKISEVSGDKAYSSRENYEVVKKCGGMAFIPFKKNASGKTKGSPLWRKMYHYFMYNNDEFMQHYHKRSNIESTFHMMKTKFGDSVKSKTLIAQYNEVLCKVLCHNICVVIQEMYELGIDARFSG